MVMKRPRIRKSLSELDRFDNLDEESMPALDPETLQSEDIEDDPISEYTGGDEASRLVPEFDPDWAELPSREERLSRDSVLSEDDIAMSDLPGGAFGAGMDEKIPPRSVEDIAEKSPEARKIPPPDDFDTVVPLDQRVPRDWELENSDLPGTKWDRGVEYDPISEETGGDLESGLSKVFDPDKATRESVGERLLTTPSDLRIPQDWELENSDLPGTKWDRGVEYDPISEETGGDEASGLAKQFDPDWPEKHKREWDNLPSREERLSKDSVLSQEELENSDIPGVGKWDQEAAEQAAAEEDTFETRPPGVNPKIRKGDIKEEVIMVPPTDGEPVRRGSREMRESSDEDDLFEAYRRHILSQPKRRKPSTKAKILAALAGAGVGLNNPAGGVATALGLIDRPHEQSLRDWQTKGTGLRDITNLKSMSENRQMQNLLRALTLQSLNQYRGRQAENAAAAERGRAEGRKNTAAHQKVTGEAALRQAAASERRAAAAEISANANKTRSERDKKLIQKYTTADQQRALNLASAKVRKDDPAFNKLFRLKKNVEVLKDAVSESAKSEKTGVLSIFAGTPETVTRRTPGGDAVELQLPELYREYIDLVMKEQMRILEESRPEYISPSVSAPEPDDDED